MSNIELREGMLLFQLVFNVAQQLLILLQGLQHNPIPLLEEALDVAIQLLPKLLAQSPFSLNKKLLIFHCVVGKQVVGQFCGFLHVAEGPSGDALLPVEYFLGRPSPHQDIDLFEYLPLQHLKLIFIRQLSSMSQSPPAG